MKYIWKLTEHIEDVHRQKTVFLAVSACVWGLLAFAAAVLVSLFIYGPSGILMPAVCAAGYGSILVGIYGGVLYLYRND